jgi:hypothetical protein
MGIEILGRTWWFNRLAQQVHLDLLNCPAAFAVITGRAGCDQILPGVLSSQVAGDDMIYRQGSMALPTVLAGVFIPTEDFPLGQPDSWARPVDHFVQTDNRWFWKSPVDSLDFTAAIQHQAGLAAKNQVNRPVEIADVDRFEISIQNQDRLIQSALHNATNHNTNSCASLERYAW